MTYRVSFYEVDVSKIISVHKLWGLVLAHSGQPIQSLNSSTALAEGANTQMQAIELYMKTHTDRVHMYSGMFDAHVVFPQKIADFLQASVAEAYPWRLSIDSLDTFVLLYSLLVLCFAILYNNISENLTAGTGPKPDEPVSIAHLNGPLMLFDLGYWLLLYLVIFITIDCTSYISISVMTSWAALMYTSTLYAACLPLDLGSVSRIALVAIWCVQTVFVTFITNASMLNGSFLVFMHLYNVIFCYVQLGEGIMTYIKFINVRMWGVVFLNACLLVTYTNNISMVASNDSGQY